MLSIAASAVIPPRTKPEITRQIASRRWYLYLLFPPLSLLVNDRAAFLPPIPTWFSCHSSNKLRGVGLRTAGAAPTPLSVATASTAMSSSLPPVALVPPCATVPRKPGCSVILLMFVFIIVKPLRVSTLSAIWFDCNS